MFDTPPPPGPDPAQYERVMSEIEERAQKAGLYMNGSNIATDERGVQFLYVTFSVGKIAFTDRVINPEKAKVEDEIREMDMDLAGDESKMIQSELEDDLKDLEE